MSSNDPPTDSKAVSVEYAEPPRGRVTTLEKTPRGWGWVTRKIQGPLVAWPHPDLESFIDAVIPLGPRNDR